MKNSRPWIKKGWYHNASDACEVEIINHEQLSEQPWPMHWEGPFRTWRKAQADAISYYATDKERAEYALKLLRAKEDPTVANKKSRRNTPRS